MQRKYFKHIIVASLVIFFVACSKGEDYKVVSGSELLPQAEGNYNYQSEAKSQDTIPKLSQSELAFKAKLPEITFDSLSSKFAQLKTPFIPNQLGYKAKKEFFFNLDSTQYHFIQWTYRDSLETINAFYNWLDCFGKECLSIKINEEIHAQPYGMLIWINKKDIIYLESSARLDKKFWESKLFESNKDAWVYVIQQSPNGKLKWIKSAIKKSDTLE